MRHTAAEKYETIRLGGGLRLARAPHVARAAGQSGLRSIRGVAATWSADGRGSTRGRRPRAGTGTGFPRGCASASSKRR